MTVHDDEGRTDDAVRRMAGRRRAMAVGGVAGMAVLLGGGAYLVMSGPAGREATVAQDTRPLAPLRQSVSPPPTTGAPASAPTSASVSTSPAPAASSGGRTARTGSPAASEDEAAVRKKIMAAREAAAKDGIPLQRPLTAPPGAMRAADDTTETTTPLPDGGVRRMVAARGDLSGDRLMLWAADDGTPVDGARCTQRFHFSGAAPAAVRPTMMLCWRLSDSRSVVVLTITRNGRPSATESAAEIDKQWRKLG
ncbi:hypothetical protein [Actinoplanes subtropicus]|uniref:hypothetical protein n=1 Tax=Actinoplanes subtropicus TaxID=543632 RepID=UPI000A8DE94A|nr:hypothetical protein [Actinoplanes subtropicus]